MIAAMLFAVGVSASPPTPPTPTPPPTGVPIPFYDAVFNDPNGRISTTLLTLYVDTTCPNSVQVQITIPAAIGTSQTPNVGGYVTGTSWNYATFTGLEDASFLPTVVLQTADISWVFNNADGSSVVTFTNFVDYYSLSAGQYAVIPGSAGFTGSSNAYGISVDVPDSLLSLSPYFLTSNGEVTVSSTATPSLYSVTQTVTSCDPAQTTGDPQFAGFQGQNFQFHGMADEVFNLISTPTFQMNGNFKYLSSGKCDYNETVCYTHPGTYIDQIGFTIGDVRVKAVAGSHPNGLRLWMNDVEVFQTSVQNKIIFAYWNSSEQSGSVQFSEQSKFTIDVPQFAIEVTNSDYFFNLEVALKDASILRSGSKKTNSHKPFLCSSSGMKSSERLAIVEDEMAKHYPRVPIHGLIGQTWRNAVICNHAWVGDASDYVTSSLFSHDSAFNYYETQQ